MRREAPFVAVLLVFAWGVAALVLGLSGARLLWSDEWVYACAAREVAAGRPPLAAAVMPVFVQWFGFPYPEVHAPGQTQAIALAFRALGPREVAALAPSVLAHTLAVLGVYVVARRAGAPRRVAGLAGTLVAAFPTSGAFVATAFPELPLAVAFVLGALALTCEDLRARTGLLALATAVGVVFRESMLLLPVAAGLALFRRGERRGLVAPAVALAVGLAALPLIIGPAISKNAGSLGWQVHKPLIPDASLAREDLQLAFGLPRPRVEAVVLLRRAWVMVPQLVWTPVIEGAGATLLAVHAAAAAALAGLRAAPPVRTVATYAVALWAGKLAFLLFLYEGPGYGARHLAAESSVLVLAAVLALGRAPRLGLALAVATLGGSLVLDAHVARRRAERAALVSRYTEALARLAPTAPGEALIADGGWRLPWDRPGTIVSLPPATTEVLGLLAARLPARWLVLDPAEPLLRDAVRPPSRIGPFELKVVDRSLGTPLLVYERSP